ncbi:hypothetical protein NLG97_g756 [Lecanicillium saksenae]|uniref:Uncharacterized protein n=1 Tax=Lecanicillium saksenae TaxID=468837 RepID=A0ACC1R5M6_9HYPO|nr:hypothetical protein NLG97_g756 [Lecanicillium saksenae]
MKFSAGLVALASLATALPGPAQNPGINVRLEAQGSSKVKAVVTNSGSSSVKILKTGSILDDLPVQKASVSGANGNVAFEGVKVFVAQPDESAFLEIPSGSSIEVEFDVAEGFDLSTGGNFDVQSAGVIRYAQGGDISNLASVSYSSNTVATNIDGDAAAQIFTTFKDTQVAKRATISGDCTGSQRQAVETARQNTLNIAKKAAAAARNGPANKMVEYFESAGQSARNTVATAFDKMVNAYQSSSSGRPDLHCRDAQGYCTGGVVAYTLPPQNLIVYCSAWFNYPALNSACRQVDQAHIAVHESTHLSMVKGTDDYGTYGYQNSINLPASKNLNHADTYAYFAHDTLSGC